jgi:hypothetical protein
MRSVGLIAILISTACSGSSKPPEPATPIGNQVKPAAESDPQLADEGSSADCGTSYGGMTYGCLGLFGSLTGVEGVPIEGELVGGIGMGRLGDDGGGTGGGTSGHASGSGSGYGVGGGRRLVRPTADSTADKAAIRSNIKHNIHKIQACYEEALLQDAKLTGKVTTKFTIGADGKVTSSTASGVHADVAACIAHVIHTIEFPKPTSGGVVNVVYPFVFKSQGD